jgi:heat shock protein HtpX
MTRPEAQLGPGTPALLVYDRIDANRRKTRLLLVLFALAVLPVVSGSAVFIVPWRAMYASAVQAYLASLQGQPGFHPGPEIVDLLAAPAPVLWLYGGVLLVSITVVVLAFAAATNFLILRYGSRVLLRDAGARPIGSGEERDLVQLVENLCIGAGLPLPRIHVIESESPNAFAIGRNPHDASLVVTRGLLTLLNRRELEGAIAHELSHIGNHDITVSTTLAALVGTLSLPLRLFSYWFGGVEVLVPLGVMCVPILLYVIIYRFDVLDLALLRSGEFWQGIPSYLVWWSVYAIVAALYAVFGAPVVALFIRQAVSRQREFLADADAALLTRDPEALALALVKIGAVSGERLPVGEATVHLYFVDPLLKGSWLHGAFPSHPPLEQRIELLARMGNGITPAAVQAARDAAASVHASAGTPTETTATNDHAFSGVYQRSGDVDPQHRLAPSSGDAHTLTPLYEKPDGWSRVLTQLRDSAAVTPIATEGAFVRINTADGQAGYVSRSAPLAALKNFQT